jgi:hypothetical protein
MNSRNEAKPVRATDQRQSILECRHCSRNRNGERRGERCLRVLYPFGPYDTQQRCEPRDLSCIDVPCTDSYQQYVAQQRDAFKSRIPPPDFPGGAGESQFSDAANLSDIVSDTGKQAMGLAPISVDGKDEKTAALAKEVNGIFGY